MSIDAQECISSDIRMHTQISMRQQTKLDERKKINENNPKNKF